MGAEEQTENIVYRDFGWIQTQQHTSYTDADRSVPDRKMKSKHLVEKRKQQAVVPWYTIS